MSVPPKVGARSRFALRYPWVLALASGAIVLAWCWGVLGLPLTLAAGLAVVTALVVLYLWFPRIGPARRYTERLLEQERDG
jgi:hypothetical protein